MLLVESEKKVDDCVVSMLREKPGCYVWLGNGPGTGGCTLHNPHYDFCLLYTSRCV